MQDRFYDVDRMVAIRQQAEMERAAYLASLVRRVGHSVAAFFSTHSFGAPAARG